MKPVHSLAVDPIQQYLVCPKCRADIGVEERRYVCVSCGTQAEVRDRVFLAKPLGIGHYFDDNYQVMQRGNQSPGVWELCYAQQSRIAAGLIQTGDVVLDIGCGPAIHFARPQDCVLIGVDPSFDSLRINTALDVRVFAGAEAMPLRNQSVDRVFFFYSIHHMIGQTVNENRNNLNAALQECGRVIRKGGTLVIFDLSPWWPAWHVQTFSWDAARRLLANKLDMFFWKSTTVQRLAALAFTGATFESRTFRVSPFLIFPPIFSVPGFKLPRLLFPFDLKMYKWTF